MDLSEVTKFQLRRENPFEGLIIDADTWRDAHSYHRDQHRLHVLTFHRTGIVGGMEVIATDPPDRSVVINPGIGIDPQGNTIIVQQSQKYKIQSKRKGLIYLVIFFREVPAGPYQPAEGGQPTRITEGYRIEERTSLPEEPYLELARIDFDPDDPVIRDPVDPANPRSNEIDFRYRQGAAALVPQEPIAHPIPTTQEKAKLTPESAALKRETVSIGHVVLGQGTKDLHLQGLQNLAREISASHSFDIKLEKNISISKNLNKCSVLYLTGTGSFEIAEAEQSALKSFLQTGGIIIGEGCTEGDSQSKAWKEFGLAFNKLATQLERKLESVQRGHPLLTSAHIFAAVPDGAVPGMLLASNGMVYSGSDYACAWQGGYTDRPLNRETIRSAVEMGVNLMLPGK